MFSSSLIKKPIIWVAALGYFVDIYDLLLFSIIRIPSLTDLGIQDIAGNGLLILNTQMFGLLLGGILWGILGDKLGRTRVLFFSIALYSVGIYLMDLYKLHLNMPGLDFLQELDLPENWVQVSPW